VAGRIADSVLTLSGARASGLRLLRPDGSLVAVARGGEAATYLPAGHVTPPGMGISGRAVAEARPVATADVFSDPRIRIAEDMRRRLAGSTLGAYLAVPLRLKERVIGALWIGDRPGRTFTEREIDVLQMFADQAALALENARLYERLEERARKLAALSQLTHLVTSAADSAHVFPAVARCAAHVFEAGMARVWVDEPAAGGLRARGSFGIDPEIEGIMTDYPVIAYGHGVVGRIFESRTPEFLSDLGADPRWLNRRLVTEAGLCAFAGLPLVVGDRTVGVLSIIFGEQRDFDAEDRELMAVIADQAAIAINRARLYEDLEARAARLRTLAHLNRIVSSSLDTREVLDGIARAAAELMAAPLVAIWTADEAAGVLERHAFSDAGLGADHPGRVRRFGEGGVGWVARHRQPLNVPDVFADERIISRDWFERHGLRSTLAVPILFQDALLGVLVLFGRQPFVLDADSQDLLDSFVAQAAVALRNARVYGELREAKARLERSQAQLVQAERLSALGEMAAGVAHDFNNLLAVILGRAELLHRRLGDTELGGWVEAIRQAAQDGADTVRRIQEFTRTRTTRVFEPVDVGGVLRDVVELTRPRWQDEARSRGVRYDVSVAGEATPTVAGRPEELREVFTNLLANALDAMPEGGRCVLRAAVHGDVVEVTVSDTGCGMAEDVRQRVFEPFFTTKGPRGNGLGLAVVWGIVKRHGGTIALTSAPGAGSTFTVRLPAAVIEPPEPAPVPAPAAAGPARILVVDDDPAVRRVLADLLAEAGYGVVEADGGPAALECCGAETFDLVLSDLSMPGMSGWDLAAACLERFPDLPVGLITGWGDRLDAAQLARHRVRFVIAKPFESRDVLTEIARVLEDQRGG